MRTPSVEGVRVAIPIGSITRQILAKPTIAFAGGGLGGRDRCSGWGLGTDTALSTNVVARIQANRLRADQGTSKCARNRGRFGFRYRLRQSRVGRGLYGAMTMDPGTHCARRDGHGAQRKRVVT